VLQSPHRALNMQGTQLANACDASAATVSRFCRELGYAGYHEFQLDLAAALAQGGGPALDDFHEGASPETILEQVFECNRLSLADTLKMLDSGQLIEVAHLARKARRVLFLGIGGSGLVAREGAQRLISLGLHATAVVDPYDQVFVTASVDARDLVVCISHTGRTVHVVEAAQVATRGGARTAALTNYPRSPLAEACEFALVTAFRERHINAAVSSSRIAQSCVIDALYFIVASWKRKNARRLADDAERRVRQTLRHRPAGRGRGSGTEP